ncbi:hypothetical protein [Streptomyces sp. V1I6]|nr:hypothetical protein [Streptomyces sp. V1I6]MDQ0846801.1 hypothetical protein [Streptomyces sp. V1I6]
MSTFLGPHSWSHSENSERHDRNERYAQQRHQKTGEKHHRTCHGT